MPCSEGVPSFALPGAYDRFGALGRDIGVADATDSDQEAAEKFLKAVESLVNELDTPTLEQFGINKEEFFNVIDKWHMMPWTVEVLRIPCVM